MDLETARKKAIEYGLDGPLWAFDTDIPIDQIRALLGSDGGCGPGKFGDWLVPDSILGVSIKPACYVHDCMYHDAKTADERYEADERLFTNAGHIIRAESNWFTRIIRRRILLVYFDAVDLGGASSAGG